MLSGGLLVRNHGPPQQVETDCVAWLRLGASTIERDKFVLAEFLPVQVLENPVRLDRAWMVAHQRREASCPAAFGASVANTSVLY